MKYSLFIVVSLFILCMSKAAFPSELTDRVKGIFEKNCTVCHGGPSAQLFNLLNVKELEEKGIVQGKAESKIYRALNRTERWMPLGKDPLSIADKTTILDWLEAGFPPLVEEPIPVANPLDYNDETRCIANDLLKTNEFLARDYRYAVLANYYNGKLKGNIERLAEAVSKLFNSISLADVYPLVPIECNGNKLAILRLDLRKLNQNAKRWDDVVIDGNYPYHYDRRDIKGFEAAIFYEREIARLTQAKTIAFVRADWLVEIASKDPIYSNLLFKDVKVKTIDDFERKFLRVDTFRQLFQTYEARQAIFRRSGVTLFNRVLQHYDLDLANATGFTYRSSYWKTFDTINDKDERNFFAFPFGPLYDWYQLNEVKFLANRAFKFDATEVIFSTPGGLAFSLFDGKGKRIEEALTEVAVHAANAVHPIIGISKKASTVVNGVSCYACHSGMNTYHDEGRKHVNASTDFSNEQIDFFNKISYRDQTEIDNHVSQTNKAYAVSQKNLGAKQVAYVDIQEPIFATAKWYLEDVDVCQFGAELGFTCDEIKWRLNHAPELARLLGLSETLSGRASRQNIERLQVQIAKDLNLGIAVVFKGVVIIPPKECKFVVVNKTYYPQRFDRIRFTDKTYEGFYLNPESQRTFDHDSNVSIDACLYYQNNSCVVHKKVTLNKCLTYDIVRGNDGYSYFKEAR